MMPKLDLDVAVPEGVAKVLRKAAQSYYESQSDLQSVWGDPDAGRVWRELAKVLERAAASCERACGRYV